MLDRRLIIMNVGQGIFFAYARSFLQFYDCGFTSIVRVYRSIQKGKVIPYSLPSVGPGADPSVQAVSPHVTF